MNSPVSALAGNRSVTAHHVDVKPDPRQSMGRRNHRTGFVNHNTESAWCPNRPLNKRDVPEVFAIASIFLLEIGALIYINGEKDHAADFMFFGVVCIILAVFCGWLLG